MQALHVDASPLNSKKIHEKHQLKEAYSDFWNNNIKFKKGWESPAIEYKEVQDLLDEAADISIRIRSSLDDKDNSFKLRMIDGSARELLWDKCNNRDPLNDPQQFVRDIVHATFKDANGYVEGLSEEKIDELIEQYYQSQLNPHSSALDHNLVQNLNSAWKTAQENVNSLFSLDILQLPPSDAPVYKVNHQALHSLLRDLERLSQKAIEIKKQQENPPMKVEEVAPSSISEESSKGPTIEEVAEPKEEEEKQQDTNNKEEEKANEESEATVEEVPADKMEEDNPKEEEAMVEEQQQQQQEEGPAEAVQVEDVTGPVEEPATPEPMNTTPENPPAENPPTVEHPEDKAILKIKVVAEGVDNLKKDIKSLHEVADNLNIEQLEETPEGKKTVQALQKKCLLYSEQLLKDLMSLDEIVNTPEARPLRKQQVQVIQSLMEDVDNLNSRLKTFLQHFVEKEKEEEEKRKAEEAKRKEQAAQQKQEEAEEEEEEEPQQTTSPSQERVLNLWKNLKLKPRMEVKEAPDAYIINSFIPGMKRDDIEISLGNNKRTISIAGIREPSAEEQAQLRLAVQKRLKTGGGYFHPEEDMETMLLKAGAGRFGRFEETYELPRDADVDNVGASYERGILSVTIPKIRKQNRMWGRPNYGHPSAFMNDRDFWW